MHNAFYLGAYQNAINEGADLVGLSEKDALERDCFVYRSYIALGSYQVSGRRKLMLLSEAGSTPLAPALRASAGSLSAAGFSFAPPSFLRLLSNINIPFALEQVVLSEVSDNAPTSLQAVKLMAQYMANPASRVRARSCLPTFVPERRSEAFPLLRARSRGHAPPLRMRDRVETVALWCCCTCALRTDRRVVERSLNRDPSKPPLFPWPPPSLLQSPASPARPSLSSPAPPLPLSTAPPHPSLPDRTR